MSQIINQHNVQRELQPRAEEDPRFHRPEKISPSEYFISVGPGEIEGQFYACVMAPKPVAEVQGATDDPEYNIVAKCRYGFDTEAEAKTDAARQFPSLPVLSGPDEYQYPFYDMRAMQARIDADKKRKARGAKLEEQYRKTQEGQERARRALEVDAQLRRKRR